MSAASSEKHEIIIVRRGGEGEEGHHGGAWKIAFADFMTAMMAFFLVMWLTNVSDKSTKTAIAQYFNPIELNNPVPPSEGVSRDPATSATVPGSSTGDEGKAGTPSGKPVGGEAKGGEDQALFRDPYAVLAEIVAESTPKGEAGKAQGKPDGTGLPGLNGGDAYRDPFDPTSWQLTPNAVAGKQVEVTADDFATVAVEPAPAAPAIEVAAAPPAPATPEQSDAAALEKQIEASVPTQDAADVQVKTVAGSGTVTISLADTLDTGMFQIGSARPTADAIRLMEKIAAILKDRPGEIVIRGHTDARPYSGDGQVDNWRLSTDRAHMAYYMLRRGGLDDKRVEAIEGVADRQPSNASDPEAASNRRIEILLKEPKA